MISQFDHYFYSNKLVSIYLVLSIYFIMSTSVNTFGVADILHMISNRLVYFEKVHSVSTINPDFIANFISYRLGTYKGDILLYEMLHCYLIDCPHMGWNEFLAHWHGLTKKQVHTLYSGEGYKYFCYQISDAEYDPNDFNHAEYVGDDADHTMEMIMRKHLMNKN